MVYVPEGQFEMGSNNQDTCFASPVHNVSLDAFWIDQTEVTNSMFTVFLNDQGNQTENGIKWLEPGAGHSGIVYGYIKENESVFVTEEGYENNPLLKYLGMVLRRIVLGLEVVYPPRPNGNMQPAAPKRTNIPGEIPLMENL